MGVFFWPIRLDSLDGERSVEIEAMVDTGATYSIVPTGLLRGLGVTPIDTVRRTLADGRPIDRPIGEAKATVNDRTITTVVVFGEDGVRPLLGAYTLEGLRLAVDPYERKLVPIATAWA